MKSEEFYQALVNLSVLLKTRKDFSGNRAQIAGLDQLVRGRVTIVTKCFADFEAAGHGTIILHQVGEIRRNAIAVDYGLVELDNLMGHIIQKMREEDQKRFLVFFAGYIRCDHLYGLNRIPR
ncbi:MAG: hypothetical protein Q9184_006092 [Pyrenodesmia sp. 2 TL-2023]